MLEALQNQKFHKDDVDEFKKEGWIGENNQGYLEIRPSDKLEENAELKSLVAEVVDEENQNREIIMGRVVELNTSLQKAEEKEVLMIFAKMNHENSPGGSWIQGADGTWKKK